MIKYKVVNMQRESFVVSGSLYSKVYHEGMIIKASKETLGLFCFETEKDAEQWAKRVTYKSGLKYRVIKVEPLDEGKTYTCISNPWVLNKFYSYLHSNSTCDKECLSYSIPEGTICHYIIKVLN